MFDNTCARISDDLYFRVTWASPKGESKVKATFSGDLCTNEGFRILTINNLEITKGFDKNTKKKTYFVGSLAYPGNNGTKIFANTWFPDAKKGDEEVIKLRNQFALDCILAISEFCKGQKEAKTNAEQSTVG